ncbi:MAG TPA: LysR family transcriptional regulator [Burkholderiaceae bacterium]|nr:LysR family transcriptional regulator [Burkholderiaceae bacterium]
MDRWRELELMVHLAELGSLTRAAEAMGTSNAAASRALAALEARLGARLVERSTRRLSLTEQGDRFVRQCRSAMAEIKEAENEVNAATLNPTGTLRLTASVSFAVHHVAPLLPSYTARWPNVRVHVVTANRYVDVVDNNIDLAIRTREYEADSGLTIRRLATTRRLLAASPAYLSRFGTPRRPEDLAGHRMLIYSYANRPDELRLSSPQGTQTVRIEPFLESNEGQVVREAALNGLGILVQPTYIIHDDLVGGRLVPLLEDWDLPRLTISFAYPSRRHLPAKVRSFIDHMSEHFARQGYERRWTARFG